MQLLEFIATIHTLAIPINLLKIVMCFTLLKSLSRGFFIIPTERQLKPTDYVRFINGTNWIYWNAIRRCWHKQVLLVGNWQILFFKWLLEHATEFLIIKLLHYNIFCFVCIGCMPGLCNFLWRAMPVPHFNTNIYI